MSYLRLKPPRPMKRCEECGKRIPLHGFDVCDDCQIKAHKEKELGKLDDRVEGDDTPGWVG